MAETFGDYIKQARAVKKISRAEMARRAGFTSQYASFIENGDLIPVEDKIDMLIRVLDLDEVEAYRLANKLPLRIIEGVKRRFYAQGADHNDEV